MRKALAQCRCMRTSSVLRPRKARKLSNGPATAPIEFCRCPMRPASASSSTTATPPTMSECPLMNLVAECTTMSQPNSSGRCRYGVANVLSTTTSAPLRFALDTTASTSTSLSNGFVGVSIQTIAVSSRIAASAAAGSLRST